MQRRGAGTKWTLSRDLLCTATNYSLSGTGRPFDVRHFSVTSFDNRDRHRRGPGRELPPGAAADDGGDAGGDAALRRAERRRAVDAGRDGAARATPTRSSSPMPAAPSRSATRCCPSSGSARCCRPARAASSAGTLAAGGGDPQRPAARRAARRRSAGQPGSGGQEPRAAAVAAARPGRHDAAAFGRGGADLQPGGAGHAVWRRARASRCATSAGAPTSPSCRLPAATQPPLVLVVDDSLTVRRVTQRLLMREGYRVTLAKDGLDALEQARRGAAHRGAVRHRDAAHGRLRPGAQHALRRAPGRPAGDHDHLAHRAEAPRLCGRSWA